MIGDTVDRFRGALLRASISGLPFDQIVDYLQGSLDCVRVDFARLGSYTPEQNAARKAACAPLHPYLTQSPFFRRALEKPLGYAGDYEMMNMLYRDAVEGETQLGRALNVCFTREPAAVANKNRIAYLGDLIREAALRSSQNGNYCLRVASIGCGPARELQTLMQDYPAAFARLDVTLVDQESRALDQCTNTVYPLAHKIGVGLNVVNAGIRQLLSGAWTGTRRNPTNPIELQRAQYDLIYSAGMFDYLDDRLFSKVASSLYNCLAPGGELVIGNVAAHNPSRWVMEYLADWCLIHRSEADLLKLSQWLNSWVDAEPSGINLFLHVGKS